MNVAKGFTTLVIACTLAAPLFGQDVHFSMFDMAPLTLDPSNTGSYQGTFRIGGIYRDQWRNATSVKPYQTPNLYFDIPLFTFGKQKSSWLGAGLNFVYDRRGVAGLTSVGGALSLAAHMPLSKSRKVYLHIGAAGGITQDRVDESGFEFQDEFDQNNLGAGAYLPTGESFTDPSATYPDFAAGVSLDVILNRNLAFDVGFASQHLLEPEDAFRAVGGATDEEKVRPRKYIAHAKVDVGIGSRFALRPLAFYQFTRKASELNLQALFGIHFNDTKDITLWVGPGYRFGDAVIARLGFDFKNLRLGFAYDINVGSLSNYTKAHSFEFGVAYIAKIYPKKVVTMDRLCPRL